MTETRKQIIELISDFMDKTLSEWCIFYNKFNNRFMKTWISWNITKDNDWEYYELMFDFHKIDRVIWHYDITAVLKYIKLKNIRLLKFDWEDFIYRAKEADFIIKWKPLNLYNEQEDKELLELLLKLN